MTTVQTSTAPLVLDRLKELLDARKATSGSALAKSADHPEVQILTAPSGDPDIPDSIQFAGVPEDQEWKSLGGMRIQETYPIEASVIVLRRGAGEPLAKAVRDRAYAIMAEVATVLRENQTLAIGPRIDVRLATQLLFQGWQDNGRLAAIDFTIAIRAELSR